MALTPEQAKAMLDSLFALPDKVAKPKAKATPKAKTASATPAVPKPKPIRTTLGLTSAGFLPAMRLHTIVHQHCTCCGTDTEYMLPAIIRFESKRNTAIEIPASVEAHLPVSVTEKWEDVAQCPKCIRMSRHIEDLLAFSPFYIQLELFRG